MTDLADPPAPPALNITALFTDAVAKSAVCWIQIEDRAYAVWHVWDRDALLVVTGPGEQTLPPLPDQVLVIVPSKDTGGRLLSIRAHAVLVPPTDPAWETAVAALAAKRLNATDDLPARWRETGTIYAIHPFAAPVEQPGAYAQDSGAARVTAGRGTTVTWRPTHLRGRPWVRRRLR